MLQIVIAVVFQRLMGLMIVEINLSWKLSVRILNLENQKKVMVVVRHMVSP